MVLDTKEETDFDSEIAEFEEERVTLDTFFYKNRASIVILLLGLIFLGLGIFFFKQGYFGSSEKIEILTQSSITPPEDKKIVVDISGAVEKPGVYKFSDGARVEELLIAAGGISADADRDWVEKYINRAARLSDGQKLYILKLGEQSKPVSANNYGGIKVDQGVLGDSQTALININTASLSELDSLPGIGQVYGQSIIEHRPYSNVDELVSKGALKQGIYDKIKNLVATY